MCQLPQELLVGLFTFHPLGFWFTGNLGAKPLNGITTLLSVNWLSIEVGDADDDDDDLDDEGDDDEQEDEDDDADVISLSEQHLHFRAVPDARSSFWMHIKIIVHRINCKRLVEKHTRYDPHDTELNDAVAMIRLPLPPQYQMYCQPYNK